MSNVALHLLFEPKVNVLAAILKAEGKEVVPFQNSSLFCMYLRIISKKALLQNATLLRVFLKV